MAPRAAGDADAGDHQEASYREVGSGEINTRF
jgi:hypothetical protein